MATQTNTDTNPAGLRPAPQRPTKKQVGEGNNRVPRGGRSLRPRLTGLVCQIGPGDNGEPVITIMLPGED